MISNLSVLLLILLSTLGNLLLLSGGSSGNLGSNLLGLLLKLSITALLNNNRLGTIGIIRRCSGKGVQCLHINDDYCSVSII